MPSATSGPSGCDEFRRKLPPDPRMQPAGVGAQTSLASRPAVGCITPADSALGRLRMVKQFHGDLDGRAEARY